MEQRGIDTEAEDDVVMETARFEDSTVLPSELEERVMNQGMQL